MFICLYWGGWFPAFCEDFSLENKIKAVLIDKIVHFTIWKQAATVSSKSYCMLEESGAMASILKAIREKKGVEAGFEVNEIQSSGRVDHCSLLYISGAGRDSEEISRILKQVGRSQLLTLSDHPDFLKNGGMVQFFREGGKIRFMIHLKAAEQAHIAFRSQLLRITPLYKE